MQIEIFRQSRHATPKTNSEINKRPEIKHFVAHQMQKSLTQGGVQTPKIIYLWIKNKKEPVIEHF